MAVIDQRASAYARLDKKYRLSKFLFLCGFVPAGLGLFTLLDDGFGGAAVVLTLLGVALVGGGVAWGRTVLGQMRYVITYPPDPMAHLVAWGGSVAVVAACTLIGMVLETGMTAVVAAGLLAVPPWLRKRRTAFMLDYAGITAAGTAHTWDQISVVAADDTVGPDRVRLSVRLRSGTWSDGVVVERPKYDLDRIVGGVRTLAPQHVSVTVTDRTGEYAVHP